MLEICGMVSLLILILTLYLFPLSLSLFFSFSLFPFLSTLLSLTLTFSRTLSLVIFVADPLCRLCRRGATAPALRSASRIRARPCAIGGARFLPAALSAPHSRPLGYRCGYQA